MFKNYIIVKFIKSMVFLLIYKFIKHLSFQKVLIYGITIILI